MSKTVLLVSELLQDLNRMKDWFPEKYRIKGVNSYSAVPNALRSELPEMIVLRIRNLDDFFSTYETIRTSVHNKNTPIVAIAEIGLQTALVRNVELSNAKIIGSSVTDVNMIKIIREIMGEESGE